MGMRERGAQVQGGLSASSWDMGSREVLQQAARREKDRSGMTMQQQRGDTQHSIKLKGKKP